MESENTEAQQWASKQAESKFSVLSLVPLDIWRLITDYLPPESAQVLALTCKPLYFTLGTQQVNASRLGARMEHRYNFYHLYVRDCPDHIYCYYCAKMHHIESPSWHSRAVWEHVKRTSCGDTRAYRPNHPPCLLANCENFFFIHPKFTFVVMQMVMKRWRQGRDHARLLALLQYPTTNSWIMESFQQQSHEARISDGGRIIYRQQTRCKIRRVVHYWNVCVRVCPHFSLASLDSFGLNSKILRLPEGSNMGNLIQCRGCRTEFRVDIVKYGDGSRVLFLTKWLDLGEAHIPTDPAWQNHVLDYFYDRSQKRKIRFARGSIFRAFEKEEPFRFRAESLWSSKDMKSYYVEEALHVKESGAPVREPRCTIC